VLKRDRLQWPVVLQPQIDMRAAAISPDGRFAATSSHNGPGGVKLWHAKDGSPIKELPVGRFAGAVFSPDGKWLAVRGSNGGRILTVGTWEERSAVGLWTCIAFSPDSRLLAVGTREGVFRLLDPATGREKARLEDPNQNAAGWLGFTPDGARLVTVSDDGQAIQIWDLRLIRRQLDELKLDWDEPPYPPAPPPRKLEPLHVTVAGADLVSAPGPNAVLTYELQCNSLRLLVNPFDVEAYAQCGCIQVLLKKPEQAVVDLNIALVFRPDHAGARYWRGWLHQQQGRWQQAIVDYTRILQAQPDDRQIHGLRDDCRRALGQR
jgi:hypothetical protein